MKQTTSQGVGVNVYRRDPCGMVTLARHVAPPSLGTLPTATALAVVFATLAPATVTSALAPAGDSLAGGEVHSPHS